MIKKLQLNENDVKVGTWWKQTQNVKKNEEDLM